MHPNQNYLTETIRSIQKFNSYHDKTLPLCAAENPMSSFAKLPLVGNYHERYIMGGMLGYKESENFIGSSHLQPFHKILGDMCSAIFGATYSDARTLSGMHCLTTLLMSLTQSGQTIMILHETSGGHGSVAGICARLGLCTISVPFNHESCEIDYDALNNLLKKKEVHAFLYAPSDIIVIPDFSRIHFPHDTVIMYDATQTLGLIAAKIIENPFDQNSNIVLFGGTHKTIPGPSCGLVLTRDFSDIKKLDHDISPAYMRHPHMHHIVSLIFTLHELISFGVDYQINTVGTANRLGECLADEEFDVIKPNENFTATHQIFIRTDAETMDRMVLCGIYHGVALNKKEKDLFNGHGIRIGTQEIARYKWPDSTCVLIAKILKAMSSPEDNSSIIEKYLALLPGDRTCKYTFSEEYIAEINDAIKAKAGKIKP